MTTTTYRWNSSEAAEAFDAAAEHIHPYYLAVQEVILANLPFEEGADFSLVDLGGGSGRLVERVLAMFPAARAMVIDQSEAFLALAERRLQKFGSRASVAMRRLQEDWPAELTTPPNVVVSMSAIHHLEPSEKKALYQRVFDVLATGGVFMNGDEYRPESDEDYLAALQRWSDHKDEASRQGLIPKSFDGMFAAWHERNIGRFGEPRKSGDDCHETIATQAEYLRDAGFTDVATAWQAGMWGVLIANKS